MTWWLVVCLLRVACAAPAATVDTLHLPLRVHLLVADPESPLSTTNDSADVREMLGVANRVWAQAAIVWHAESIVREVPARAAVYDSLLRGQIPMAREPLTGFIPRERLLAPGWNLFLIRNFGQFGGGMFRPDILGVLLPQRGMGTDLPPGGRGGATLAHELGHALGLAHESCDATRNAMANGCWQPETVSSLTPDQVERARRQAKLGVPVAFIPTP